MKLLVTRVNSAKVVVGGKVIGSIGFGLVVFVGIEKNDTRELFYAIAEKIVHLRIFDDEEGKFNYSLHDKNYPVLCVSNFTLCAATGKGRRPSFDSAMDKALAEQLFPDFVEALREKGLAVEIGSFGAHMDIDLNLNGPVNIIL
jgi:D-tyrosyl-tRNA(Tyr) deacylase